MGTFEKHSKIAIIHGLVLFALLTGFFLLMRLLGLAENFYLRAINAVFVYLVLNSVINKFHKRAGVSYYEDFFDFFKLAFRAGMIGVVLFAAFLAIYLDQLDPAFMDQLRADENSGGLVTPVVASFVIILEGIASVVIIAFAIIQLRKARTVERPDSNTQDLENEPRSR